MFCFRSDFKRISVQHSLIIWHNVRHYNETRLKWNDKHGIRFNLRRILIYASESKVVVYISHPFIYKPNPDLYNTNLLQKDQNILYVVTERLCAYIVQRFACSMGCVYHVSKTCSSLEMRFSTYILHLYVLLAFNNS